MHDETKTNLSSLLNESTEDNKKKSSNFLYFFIFILVVTIIYLAVVLYSIDNKKEVKKLVVTNKIIKIEKTKNLQIIDSKVSKDSKVIKVQNSKVKTPNLIKNNSLNFSKKDKFLKIYNSNNYKLINCYDYKAAAINPSESCKNKIAQFLTENKDAIRFQIISVVSEKDINDYKNYDKNIKELIVNGLSIKRIIEITWYSKKVLGEKTIITSNNYYIKSTKDTSGVVLKAYY